MNSNKEAFAMLSRECMTPSTTKQRELMETSNSLLYFAEQSRFQVIDFMKDIENSLQSEDLEVVPKQLLHKWSQLIKTCVALLLSIDNMQHILEKMCDECMDFVQWCC